MPFWQNPHIGTCSSIQACCTGCRGLPRVLGGELSLAGPPRGAVPRAWRSACRPRRVCGATCTTALPCRPREPSRRAALREPAPELRSAQFELVSQDIQEGDVGGDVELVRGSVDDQRDTAAKAVRLLVTSCSHSRRDGPPSTASSAPTLPSAPQPSSASCGRAFFDLMLVAAVRAPARPISSRATL